MEKRNLIEEMNGKWLDYYRSLGNDALYDACEKLGQNCPCPKEGGKDGFRLFKDADRTGGGVKQSLQSFSSGYGLLMWLEDKDKREVARDLFKFLDDGTSHTVKTQAKSKAVDIEKNQSITSWVNATWQRAKKLENKHFSAMNYFDSRGVKRAALGSSDLRFAFLNYTHNKVNLGKCPALVARVTNNDNEIVGLHRTYLDKDGKGKKAEIFFEGEKLPSRKLTTSIQRETNGRMIRLFDVSNAGVLHLAEGIETALSVLQVFGQPTYSLINASNFRSFMPHKGVSVIHNWVDKDVSKTGETHAEFFARRMSRLGITVINHVPVLPIPAKEKSIDWNDVLLHQPSAFFID